MSIDFIDEPEVFNSNSEHSVEQSIVDTFFKKPDSTNNAMYWLFHPHQPTNELPFTADKAYKRKDGSYRKWLSYSTKDKALFCCICLAYGRDSGVFIRGFSDWKHVYVRIQNHEESAIHRYNVDAHVMKTKFASVDSLLVYGQSSLRRKEVENTRQIMHRIIDVIKLIGKRGLSYRNRNNEAAYTLNDTSLDHGNFLEIILLLSKYDEVIKCHLDKVIKKSTKSHNKGSSQGGGVITLLSKTTINYIIEAICQKIKFVMSEEILKAGMYTVQLDTTQDISVVDQCSVIIRYVSGTTIHERLVGMVKCTSSKGIDMVELILKVFNSLKLDPKKCVGNATDGAANMQGEYRGFSAQLSNVANKQIHIWCYAHVLNLVIGDVTNKILQSINLFGILNGCAVFIKESHKRMDVWTNKEKNKRICSIGETRWWSKHSALSKVFGNFKRPEPGLFVELLTTLIEIKNDVSITADARYKAIGLIEGLCKYETILTAQIYLRIFQKTTPLSKYLQGHGINMMTSFQMVQATLEELKLDVRDFASVKEAADNFVTRANNKLEVEECEVEVSHSFPETRKKKNKAIFL